MEGWLSRLVRRRRVWLVLGLPVCAVIAISSVASISLFQPEVSGKSLGYAVAGIDLYLGPEGGLVNNQKTNVPTSSSSRRSRSPLRWGVRTAGHDREIFGHPRAPDCGRWSPDLNQSVFGTAARRGEALLPDSRAERSLPLTVNEDLALPEIGVTAQAPTPTEAIRLASASQVALGTYLTGIETRSSTPRVSGCRCPPWGRSRSLTTRRRALAMLRSTFLLSYALWSGLVVALMAIVRDLRKLRRGWTPERVNP